MLYGAFAWSVSTGATGRTEPANKSFNFWWRYITKKKLSAYMYCDRKICFVSIFGVGFLNDYVRGNQFSKVVHNQLSEDFLVYILHLFCVKME